MKIWISFISEFPQIFLSEIHKYDNEKIDKYILCTYGIYIHKYIYVISQSYQ